MGAVALCCGSVASESLATGLPDRVPSFVARAAQISVPDFVHALGSAGIPAGFVAFESDVSSETRRYPLLAWW
jgi:hypothetical protein